MTGFRSALAFLTVLPGGRPGPVDASTLAWFPVVGLVLGIIWAGCDRLFSLFLPRDLAAFFDLAAMIILTGALHLDGLADAADGLFSHQPPQQALNIMRDSRIGAWGVLALILVLGLEYLSLRELAGVWPLVLAPVYGRTVMTAAIGLLPYGRGADGAGRLLFDGRAGRIWPAAAIGSAALSLFLGPAAAVAVNLCVALWTVLVIRFYRNRLGCVTGDMLGAAGLTAEVIFLCAAAAV